MKYLMYAVYDSAVEFYSPPFFVRAPGEALRSFTKYVNDPQVPAFKAPNEVALFHLGVYDDVTGQCSSVTVPVRVIGGTEVKDNGQGLSQ